MSSTVSRRTLLQLAGIAAGGGLASIEGSAVETHGDSAGEEGEGEDEVEGDAAIPAPFNEIPTTEEPTDFERELAEVNFPPEAVPDEGPVPDVHHQHIVEAEITVPAWALEAARWRLSNQDEANIDRGHVEDFLIEYVQFEEQFVTPDGRDAVDTLLAGLQEGDDGE